MVLVWFRHVSCLLACHVVLSCLGNPDVVAWFLGRCGLVVDVVHASGLRSQVGRVVVVVLALGTVVEVECRSVRCRMRVRRSMV